MRGTANDSGRRLLNPWCRAPRGRQGCGCALRSPSGERRLQYTLPPGSSAVAEDAPDRTDAVRSWQCERHACERHADERHAEPMAIPTADKLIEELRSH